MSLEIERKFLLREIPQALIEEGQLQLKSEHRIEQTYLALAGDQELRVRRIRDLATEEITYTHTFKKGHGLLREEIEYEISKEIYEQITRIHQSVPLTKNRVTADWSGRIIEIDLYDQIDLMVLEVEFSSEEEATQFIPPVWFGLDISTNKEYSNKKVWKELQERTV
ncbi:CYTH domain-containing protein [Paenibacillus lentus]|uniref:CYTH domain-containing protein n=1 Tax=Paenibacillus lentus TaxID=1338368 RepID=A0A3S8S059_9BACL|nr:CYTH domain-containing protein [Paenibacillus lentus]AZK48489.1 CYTH domain-containing protein [Paenibacillus lentus]